jgi:hypothetical protein
MKSTVLQRTNLLKNCYPKIQELDPFDYNTIRDVKRFLFDSNCYDESSMHCINDETIIRLIVRAQGKKVIRRWKR